MTIIEKFEKKAKAVAKRHSDDLDFIGVYTTDDRDIDRLYGFIALEFNEWGGPKMRGGKIVGDHDCYGAVYEMEKFAATMGAKLELVSAGDDIEHHKLYTYRVVFV